MALDRFSSKKNQEVDVKKAARNLIVLFLTFTALDIGVFAILAFVNQGDLIKSQADAEGRALGNKVQVILEKEEKYIEALKKSSTIVSFRAFSGNLELIGYKPESNNKPASGTEIAMMTKATGSNAGMGRDFSVELNPDTTEVMVLSSVADKEEGIIETLIISSVDVPSIEEDFVFLIRQFLIASGVILFAHSIFLLMANQTLLKPLKRANELLQASLGKSVSLLLNILPEDIANELQESGKVEPREYVATVLFTDFTNFTVASSSLSPTELVERLSEVFDEFDRIAVKHRIEKIKTIGDAYMAVGGLPRVNETHPIDAILAGLEMRDWVQWRVKQAEDRGEKYWNVRVGVHTGPVLAGVIGTNRFAFDIWGDAVNIASRMESNSVPAHVNISGTTYEIVRQFFECEERGELEVKGKGKMRMHFVHRAIPGLN